MHKVGTPSGSQKALLCLLVSSNICFLRSASIPANVPVGFILGNAFCPQPTPANDFPSMIHSPDVPEALMLHTR